MKAFITSVCLITIFAVATTTVATEQSPQAQKRTSNLQELIASNQSESDWYKVNKVNRFFNLVIEYQELLTINKRADLKPIYSFVLQASKRQAMEHSRWNDTIDALNSVNSGHLIDGNEVHDWLNSWGTENEKNPPQI